MTATAWDAVVGHVPVRARLRDAARDGVLGHAVLLSGPDGVGKTTVALALADELLGGGAWPGGLRAHPDHWLEDSPAERIGVERVKPGGGDPEGGPSLQDFLSLRPYAGAVRVAVVGRADRLSEPAANSILKTLEEPPPGTCIVLCAAHPERMPATILSRCQALALAPVPASTIGPWLVARHGVDPELATMAATLSGGRPGRALALATAPGVLAAEIAGIDALLRAAGGGAAAALRTAAAIAPARADAEGRERALVVLAAVTAFLRDVACAGAGAPELGVWSAYAEVAAAWAAVLPPARVDWLLGRCIATTEQLTQYAVPRLCFEVLLLDILAGDPPPPRTEPPSHAVALPAGDLAATATTTRRRPARRR